MIWFAGLSIGLYPSEDNENHFRNIETKCGFEFIIENQYRKNTFRRGQYSCKKQFKYL